MNVTVYGWTFKFHKVVRQQNSGAVEDFILPYSAVYLWIQKWKNYWNRSTFAKVIVKTKVAPFLMAHGVYLKTTLALPFRLSSVVSGQKPDGRSVHHVDGSSPVNSTPVDSSQKLLYSAVIVFNISFSKVCDACWLLSGKCPVYVIVIKKMSKLKFKIKIK